MYLKIRNMKGGLQDKDLVVNISRTALIEELQKMICDEWNVNIDDQKLYYRGKQLIKDHSIMEYGISLNDVVQLMVVTIKKEELESKEEQVEIKSKPETTLVSAASLYYKPGDLIDVIDDDHGAWFEAKILDILSKSDSVNAADETDLVFKIRMDRNEETAPFEAKFADIRPRSHYTYPREECTPGMTVLANYNIEDQTAIGYWYNFKISEVSRKGFTGSVLVGRDNTELSDCTIKLADETMRIEKPTLLTEREGEESLSVPSRKMPFYCNKCRDNPKKKCKECGCSVCALKTNPSTLILCDECDMGYHLACLDPPLEAIPPDPEWYCPDCRNDDSEIVKAGEKLKHSKKRENMPSQAKKVTKDGKPRDWGKGMACVGRTSVCTIVPTCHFGPIPGIDVGANWKYRFQVSESGVHRPPVGGIHGREADGAYSIVLSGGYEDDLDYGHEFFYTGSGGRDLSGNKRCSVQCKDQELTRMNKALALNCNAPLNTKEGSEAVDWKKGKPVRVIRNYKLRKHSKYAPLNGNRYDGIYKLIKYYPEKGKSGFVVWRYLLRRDDPNPAPWEEGGQEFEVTLPEGWEQAAEAMEKKQNDKSSTKKVSKQGKRKLEEVKDNALTKFVTSAAKKPKVEEYKITSEMKKLILEDDANTKLWKECKAVTSEGKRKFLSKVEELFLCVCCQEVVFNPITTPCKHNVCKGCLKRSFASEIYVCPWCRFDLGKDFAFEVNTPLGSTLKLLFPGYESSR